MNAVVNIFRWQISINRQINDRIALLKGRVFLAEHTDFAFADLLRKHLRIEVKPDRGNKPMLFGAKQIARSANGEVAHSDFEA
ncbi:hypothetical protein D3C74_387180 [compost metagenome]